MFTPARTRRFYIDELGEVESLPVGIATVKLVIEDEDKTIAQARELIDRTRQEINSLPQQQQLLKLIETILVYKFLNMSREEIAAMFEVSDLKQTRFYQEAKKELQQEAVPRLLGLGLSVEQIAQALDISVEQVRQVRQNQ